MTRSACKSCGAPICLFKLDTGKWMPVDAARTNDVKFGRVVYNPQTDCGHVVRKDEVGDAHIWVFEHGAHIYKSHFATCPSAGRHRKR